MSGLRLQAKEMEVRQLEVRQLEVRRIGSSTSGSRPGGMTVDGILSIADRSRTGVDRSRTSVDRSRTSVVSISGSKKAKRSGSPKSGAKVEKVPKYGSSSTCTICLNQVEDLAVLVPCRP